MEEQLTPQQINKMKALAHQAIEMRADIKVVIAVFSEAMKAFGLNEVKMNEGQGIQQLMPEIIRKLTIEFASGTFNTQALAKVQEVLPIFEKYKHIGNGE